MNDQHQEVKAVCINMCDGRVGFKLACKLCEGCKSGKKMPVWANLCNLLSGANRFMLIIQGCKQPKEVPV